MSGCGRANPNQLLSAKNIKLPDPVCERSAEHRAKHDIADGLEGTRRLAMWFWRWLRRTKKIDALEGDVLALEADVKALQAELAPMDELVEEMAQSASVSKCA
jgi:hypothetical protein